MSTHPGYDERGRWRCSIAAQQRGDQRVGTAVPAPRWFLVGHRGPWERAPLATPAFAGAAEDITAALGRAGARLQLVRRHGRADRHGTSETREATGGHHEDEDKPVLMVDCLAGTVGRASWREPADLVALADRFDDPPEQDREPLVLVCTHGRRDVCCAIEGRLVAAALHDVMPGAVWETTHLGGDRFAGNVAYLPEGSMFGGLDGASAPGVLARHLDGDTDTAYWRGRSVWAPPVQAAVADLVDAGGRLPDVTGVGMAADGPETWVVSVDLAGRRERRRVSRTLEPPRRLTCQPGTSQAARYAVTPA